MNPNYYKTILKEDWPGFDKYVEFFTSRCDSKLEVVFGLSLISEFQQGGFHNFGERGEAWIRSHSIFLLEPFGCSPSYNGASVAHLKPQEKVGQWTWDFSLYTGHDNGYEIEQCESTYVIDIDGWGIHRLQREQDARKCSAANANLMCIRVLEERFLDMREAATAVLEATIFHCPLGEQELRSKLEIFKGGKRHV